MLKDFAVLKAGKKFKRYACFNNCFIGGHAKTKAQKILEAICLDNLMGKPTWSNVFGMAFIIWVLMILYGIYAVVRFLMQSKRHTGKWMWQRK